MWRGKYFRNTQINGSDRMESKIIVKGKNIKKLSKDKMNELYYKLNNEKKIQQNICESEMKLLGEIENDIQKIKAESMFRSSQENAQMKIE